MLSHLVCNDLHDKKLYDKANDICINVVCD